MTRHAHGRCTSCIMVGALAPLALVPLVISMPAGAREISLVTSAEAEAFVVNIVAPEGRGPGEVGSGCVVAPNRMPTNQHAVGDADAVTVIFSSSLGCSRSAIAASHARDLALMTCVTGTLPVLRLSSGPCVGEKIDVEPNASGGEFAIRDATLAAFLRNPAAPVPSDPTTSGGEWVWALGAGIILGLALGYALRASVRQLSAASRDPLRKKITTEPGLPAKAGELVVVLHGQYASGGAAAGQPSSELGAVGEGGTELMVVLHPPGPDAPCKCIDPLVGEGTLRDRN